MDKAGLNKYLHTFTENEEFLRKNSKQNINQNNSNLSVPKFWDKSASPAHQLKIDRMISCSHPVVSEIVFPENENCLFLAHERFGQSVTHKHSYIEMVFVYEGVCTQIINNNRMSMKRGDLCILNPDTYHAIENADENDIIINCLLKKDYFDTFLLNRFSGNNTINSFIYNAVYNCNNNLDYLIFNNQNNHLLELFEKMLCEYYDKNPNYIEVINSYMNILFIELSRDRNKCEGFNYRNNDFNTTEIIRYIQQHVKTATLSSTAAYFNTHPVYLSKHLKKMTGKNFTDIRSEERLKKAGLLLKNTNLTILQIVEEVGYSNINFFYRLFKEKFLLTPAKYRSKYKKNQP